VRIRYKARRGQERHRYKDKEGKLRMNERGIEKERKEEQRK
jgi:hypothetical protein